MGRVGCVLVVEDEDDLRVLLASALSDAGHQVVTAVDGVAAVEVLRSGGVDAVVLDVMLPRLDGFGVLRARAMQDLVPRARVLMYTALADDRAHLRAWQLGCDAYFTKPLSPFELVAGLEDLLSLPPQDLVDRRRKELDKALVLEQLDALQSPSWRY
jgi:DNA-binding response OmpR family regulator